MLIVWPFGRQSMRRMPTWYQKIEARTFPADFCTQNFLGRGEPLCCHSIDCLLLCLQVIVIEPNFVYGHQSRQESFGSRWENSKSCSDNWQQWCFWSVFRHFGTHYTEGFRMSKSSQMMDPTYSHEIPSCSAIDLAKIWQSSKISSWIWSIIYGVVTVLGRSGRGSSQVEKSPRLNWATQFSTVTYDGACSLNVSVRTTWISFGALSCREKKLDDSLRLHVVETTRVALHASFQPL